MREIKFRAWSGKKFYTPIITESGKSAETDYGYEISGENDDPIMQYTGLKDRNGKEIYEGDIILTDQVVKWNDSLEDRGDNELYCWGIQNGKYNLSHYSSNKDFIVTGNIYQNPIK